jgi:hypothetical protein
MPSSAASPYAAGNIHFSGEFKVGKPFTNGSHDRRQPIVGGGGEERQVEAADLARAARCVTAMAASAPARTARASGRR